MKLQLSLARCHCHAANSYLFKTVKSWGEYVMGNHREDRTSDKQLPECWLVFSFSIRSCYTFTVFGIFSSVNWFNVASYGTHYMSILEMGLTMRSYSTFKILQNRCISEFWWFTPFYNTINKRETNDTPRDVYKKLVFAAPTMWRSCNFITALYIKNVCSTLQCLYATRTSA